MKTLLIITFAAFISLQAYPAAAHEFKITNKMLANESYEAYVKRRLYSHCMFDKKNAYKYNQQVTATILLNKDGTVGNVDTEVKDTKNVPPSLGYYTMDFLLYLPVAIKNVSLTRRCQQKNTKSGKL